jgi:hypothetical protein
MSSGICNIKLENTTAYNASGAKFTEAEIIFPGENFTEDSNLTAGDEELIKQGILCRKIVRIHLAKINDYAFAKNGFEFTSLTPLLADNVRQLSDDPQSVDFQVNVVRSATDFVNKWAKEAQGLKFATAVPLALTYRNEDPSTKEKCLRPFPIVHVDFDPKHLQKIFQENMDMFKSYAQAIFGELSEEGYHELCSRIDTTFTLWIPFNITPNTVCMADIESLDIADLRSWNLGVNAKTTLFNPNLKWAASPGIPVFFNLQRTPHAAAVLPEQADCFYGKEKYRRSIEIRFGLVNAK